MKSHGYKISFVPLCNNYRLQFVFSGDFFFFGKLRPEPIRDILKPNTAIHCQHFSHGQYVDPDVTCFLCHLVFVCMCLCVCQNDCTVQLFKSPTMTTFVHVDPVSAASFVPFRQMSYFMSKCIKYFLYKQKLQMVVTRNVLVLQPDHYTIEYKKGFKESLEQPRKAEMLHLCMSLS